jgi:hypothetical protein
MLHERLASHRLPQLGGNVRAAGGVEQTIAQALHLSGGLVGDVPDIAQLVDALVQVRLHLIEH